MNLQSVSNLPITAATGGFTTTDGYITDDWNQPVVTWPYPPTTHYVYTQPLCSCGHSVGSFIDAFLRLSDEDKVMARRLLDSIKEPNGKRSARK